MKGANLSWANMQGANLIGADMQGCCMFHANLQKTTNGKNTDMKRVQLAGANLSEAKLNGANMENADLQGAVLFRADLTGVQELPTARFGETYMVYAMIDKDVQLELSNKKKSMVRKIWLDDGISDDTEWWLYEKYEDGYALAGVLMNFADAPYPEHFSQAKRWLFSPGMQGDLVSIQRQAAELDLEKLPENTPKEIRVWLKEIKAKHPKK